MPRSTRSCAQNEVPVDIIIPGGDLFVNVGRNTVEMCYQVPSATLWATSSTFRAWFGPGSKFGVSISEVGTITLRGDDPEPMGLVLKMLCLQHRTLPSTVTLDQLVEVAKIADKYHFEEPIRPLVSTWTYGLKREYVGANIGTSRWLLVSWVFRFEDIFQEVTQHLSLSCAASLNELSGVPQVLIDELIQNRAHRLAKIRAEIAAIRDARCLESGVWACQLGTLTQAMECHFIQEGFFQHNVRLCGFHKDATWDESVRRICRQIRSIHDVTYVQELRVSSTSGRYTRSAIPEVHRALHVGCGWLEGLKRVAEDAAAENLHLSLSAFPSRAWI